MKNPAGSFGERAKKIGMKESKFPGRFHNGRVAIELDPRNENQIIVSWETGSGFESKRFRCGESVERWLERAFDFAEKKALESSQESLEFSNAGGRRRQRRGRF